MRWPILFVLVVSLSFGCDRRPSPLSPGTPPVPSTQTEERAGQEPGESDVVELDESLEFIELTTGDASARDSLPMVVVIHGYGDSPEGIAGLFRSLETPTRLILPRGPHLHPQRGNSWYTLGGATTGRQISEVAARVAALVQTLSTTRPTAGKPVVTGFSQGGILSFTLAVEHDGVFSAAFPIAGRLTDFESLGLPAERVTRIHAFHGATDARVPLADAQTSIEAMAVAGWETELTVVPSLGHSINPELRQALHSAVTNAVSP
jgi:phospholipase/carboxylesterase